MGRKPQVQVEGARELRTSLKRCGDDLSDLKEANTVVATTVARAAHPPMLTGQLAASIRPSGTKTAAQVRAGGARVPYAGAIHWGWPAHNITAQPFLADAAQATEPIWTATYLQAIDKELAKVKGD